MAAGGLVGAPVGWLFDIVFFRALHPAALLLTGAVGAVVGAAVGLLSGTLEPRGHGRRLSAGGSWPGADRRRRAVTVRVTPPSRGEIAGRGVAGGAAGGAAIGGTGLFLGSIGAVGLGPSLLATPFGAVGGCVLGAIVGAISGSCLAGASRRVIGQDWCARRLAFTTSAAPFLVGLGLAPDGAWIWLTAALISGLAGAFLGPWVVSGGTLGHRNAGPR